MLTVLRNNTYAKLFSAQIIALLGTGLLTVALGLLAYDIAGKNAGVILGVAMTIKMVAYVAVAPLSAALTSRLSRKHVLIGTDLVRASIALMLPFVSEAWHIYVLIFLLQSASATFTPAFQAVIPSILPDEEKYTQALSLSRLAYDLEALASPLIAAALLTIISYNNLFLGTVLGFAVSAILIFAAHLPHIDAPQQSPFLDRLTLGVREFWRRVELRGLMGLNLVVATATAMVIINTVVIAQGVLNQDESFVAIMLGVYGGGSMLVALTMPRVLARRSDHTVMLTGAVILLAALAGVGSALAWNTTATQRIVLLVLWSVLGAATSLILTPLARILRRQSSEQTRPAVFAAQFSLSHSCFLVTYPLAGVLGASLGLATTAWLLVGIGVVGLGIAGVSWRNLTTAQNHQSQQQPRA
ncbi:MFS transporter [Timonella sp. A28]|uniref:MFS transporter n=1 Tax=Timonella sp. A28 TaxID=3442640 RepID=UPI003EB6F95E